MKLAELRQAIDAETAAINDIESRAQQLLDAIERRQPKTDDLQCLLTDLGKHVKRRLLLQRALAAKQS